MANPFDMNANADTAVMGGGAADNALGLSIPDAPAGLRPPPTTAPAPARDPMAFRGVSPALADAAKNTLARMQRPANTEPQVGYNPTDNSFFSGGKTFSLNNLSVAHEAAQQGYLGINNTELPAGYLPTDASQIINKIESGAASRGAGSAVAETGRQIAAGVYADMPAMLHKAGAFLSPAGSSAEQKFGAAAKEWEAKGQEPQWAPDTYGRGVVANTLAMGGRALGPSALGMAAALTNPVVGGAAVVGGFGGSQAWDTYTKALDAGKTRAEAKALALQTGAIEGFGELGSDLIGGKVLQGAGSVLSGIGKGGTSAAMKVVTDPKWVGRTGADLLANTAIQSGTEFGQNYAETAVEKNAGISNEDPMQQGLAGLQGGIGLSLLLAPFGVHSGWKGAQQRREIDKILTNPSAPTEARSAAADRRAEMLSDLVGPEKAGEWRAAFAREEANRQRDLLKTAEWQALPAGATSDMFGGEGALLPTEPAPEPIDTRRTEQDDLFASQHPDKVETNPAAAPGISVNNSGIYSIAPTQTDAPMGRPVQPQPAVAPAGQMINIPTRVPLPVSHQQLLDEEAGTQDTPAAPAPTAVAPASPAPSATGIPVASPAPVARVFSSREALDAAYPDHASAKAAAAAAGVPVAKGARRSTLLNALWDTMVPKATPVAAPARVEPSAQDVQSELDRQGQLDVKATSTPGKASGRVSLPQPVIHGIARAMTSLQNRNPTVRDAKTGQIDAAETAAHRPAMTAIRDAAKDVARAYHVLDNAGGNAVPTASKSRLKADAGKSEVAVAQAAADKAGHDLTVAKQQLKTAVDHLIETAGGEQNVEALVAVLKGRVLAPGEKPLTQFTSDRKLDVGLSRAWAMHKDKALTNTEDLSSIRGREVRLSKESAATGASEQPVKSAAEEGYNSRPFRGIAEPEKAEEESASAYRKRYKAWEANEAKRKLVYAAAAEKGVQGILSYLQRHGAPMERMLSAALRRALNRDGAGKAVDVKWVEAGKEFYDPKTNTVGLSETASPEVILHEALHAALQWFVHTNPTHASVVSLQQSLAQVLAADTTNMSPLAVKAIEATRAAGKKNSLNGVLELVSYGNTLKDFREALMGMQGRGVEAMPTDTKRGKIVSLMQDVWTRLATMVQRFLGVTNTAANDVLADTVKLLSAVSESDGPKGPTGGGKLEADAQTGGTLYAAVQAANPEDAAQPGATASIDLRKYNEARLFKLPTEMLFRAAGWDNVPGMVSRGAEQLAEWVRVHTPGAARMASYVDAKFLVPIPTAEMVGKIKIAMRDSLSKFKVDRQIGAQITDLLANEISHRPDAEVLAIMRYLDGDKTALKDNTNAREVADMLLEHRAEYLEALRDPKAREFFKAHKFSEAMVFAKSTEETASKSLGARKLNELAAHATKSDLSESVFTPTDAEGNPILTGTFLELVDSKLLDPDTGQPQHTGFIHESMQDPQHLPTGQVINRDGLIWEHKGKGRESDTHRFTAYRDAMAAIRAGQANEVANALRNTMAILAHNYASNHLTTDLADPNGHAVAVGVVHDNLKALNDSLGTSVHKDSVLKLSDSSAKSKPIKGLYRSRYQWVQLPKGGTVKVHGEDVNVGTYGDLAGKIVRGDVWAAIEDMTDRRPVHDIQILHKMMRVFKASKTRWNPGTHVQNLASNIPLAMMHDIKMSTLGTAARLIVQYHRNPDKMGTEERRLMHAFVNSGAQLGDYSHVEVKQALYEAYTKNTAENERGGVLSMVKAFAAVEVEKHKYMQSVRNGLGTGHDAVVELDRRLADMYSGEDNIFRLAAFLTKAGEIATTKQRGYLSPEDFRKAGDFARFAFLDYDIDSKAVKLLRQTVVPFISWTYAIMPVLGHIAVHKPWKIVNLLGAYYLLEQALLAASGDSGDEDEEKRKHGPEYIRSRLWGIGPYAHVRVPFMGSDQNPVYFRLGSYIPTGNYADPSPNGFLGLSNWPSPVSPGGPFVNAIIAAVGGVDPYTGRELSPPTNSDWEKAIDRSKVIGTQFTPSWVPELGKVSDVLKGKESATGKPMSNLWMARAAGMKLYEFDMQDATIAQNRAAAAIKHEFTRELHKVARAEAHYENPDWDGFAKRRDELINRMKERMKTAKGED